MALPSGIYRPINHLFTESPLYKRVWQYHTTARRRTTTKGKPMELGGSISACAIIDESDRPAERTDGRTEDGHYEASERASDSVYVLVVLSDMAMMQSHWRVSSRLLNGRTRTATFTDDMMTSQTASLTAVYTASAAAAAAPLKTCSKQRSINYQLHHTANASSCSSRSSSSGACLRQSSNKLT